MMINYLSILVQNQAGVLVRVASLFSRRNFNIHSLAVGTTNNPALSRITIAVEAPPNRLDQIISQIAKLPVVLAVQSLDPEKSVTRGLALIKIAVDDSNRLLALQIAETFRAKVVDFHINSIICEISGSVDKINAFADALKSFPVVEFIQTGIIALNREHSIAFLPINSFFHKNLL